jgi:hypothetical protein
MIDVDVNGKPYQEMHVDGGASAQVFLSPPSLNIHASGIVRERHLYVIRNARLDPDWAQVDRSTMTIASRRSPPSSRPRVWATSTGST